MGGCIVSVHQGVKSSSAYLLNNPSVHPFTLYCLPHKQSLVYTVSHFLDADYVFLSLHVSVLYLANLRIFTW